MMMSIDQPEIEPGLLNVFRAFVALECLFACLNYLAHSALKDTWITSELILVGVTGVLAVYVFWDRVRQIAGKRYLIIGLLLAGIEIVLQSLLYAGNSIPALFDNPQAAFNAPSSLTAFNLFSFMASLISPPLFVLIIFVSWQYPFRVVVVYIVCVGLLELIVHARIEVNNDKAYVAIATALLFRNLSFVGAGYIITRLMRVQRKQRAALAEANVKLTNHAAMIESLTLSRERNRIGRELHDTLAHTLSAASVQLEAADSLWDTNHEKAHDLLMRVLGITRTGLTETRRALQALRASPLDDLGLRLALHELGTLTGQRTGCAVKLDLPDDLTLLPAEVEHTIYRVAQEGVENVARHAHAKQMEIALHQNGTHVTLHLTDDGIGFQTSRVEGGHYGLQGMAERVHALGGSLHIASRPGVGTALTVELPIKLVKQPTVLA